VRSWSKTLTVGEEGNPGSNESTTTSDTPRQGMRAAGIVDATFFPESK
jgi:hypothetical protein